MLEIAVFDLQQLNNQFNGPIFRAWYNASYTIAV